jgi:AMP phosphorylase
VKFNTAVLDVKAGKKSIIINEDDASETGLELNERARLTVDGKSTVCITETTKTLVKRGTVAIYRDVAEALGLENGEYVDVAYEPSPKSVEVIRKKIAGEKLSENEINGIIGDLISNELSDLDIASFLFSVHYKGLDMEEIRNLTLAMLNSGEKLELSGFVVDKHSIGGVPGNKVSLLIIPIVASTDLYIPKTSSRAITSPSGTADTMSVLANVKFSLKEIKEIVEKTHGCIVWGGALNLAPADDMLIRVENPLRVNPRGLMLASVMAKKLGVGAKIVALDMPVGRGTKVADMTDGEKLARDFVELGRSLGINVRAGLTYGGQPVGRAIGPALEAREALAALISPNEASMSLLSKSASLAGIILEASGISQQGQGYSTAMDIMRSGKALSKMKEIIEAQGGNPDIKPDDLPVGTYRHQVVAENDGYVTLVDNESIVQISRAAGTPTDRGAGVVLHQKQGYKVKKGDVLFEIYAERGSRLSDAVNLASYSPPIVLEGMLLKSYPQ